VNSRPLLSVLVPVFNGGGLLRLALSSLQVGSEDDLEVIVVDNESSDETPATIEEFASLLPLRGIRQSHAASWLVGANRALREARGAFVCMLHHDDAWLPGRIPALRNAVRAFPDVDFFAHAVEVIDPNGNRLGAWRAPLSSGRTPSSEVLHKLLVQNFFAAPAPVVRREVVIEAGGFNEALWYTGDWDLWLRIANRSDVVYLPDLLAQYRIHRAQQTARIARDIVELRAQLEAPVRRFLESPHLFGARDTRVQDAAALSVEVNLVLASVGGGRIPPLAPLAGSVVRAGLKGLLWYLHCSRLRDRVVPRARLLI